MSVHADHVCVGVDAGGTRVAAVAARGETIIGSGSAGPANATVVGVDAAARAIADAVNIAARHAEPLVAVVGAAGAGRHSVAEALRRSVAAQLPGACTIIVEDDVRIALRAAIPEGPGAVIVAGTGSVAYAENRDATARLGGGGYLLGDEGSGFAVGLAAVRLLLRCYEGRRRFDDTAQFVARSLDVDGRDALLDRVYGVDAGPSSVVRIASLAPAIVALATKGDDVSGGIVRNAVDKLAALGCDVARAVGLTQPRFCFGGGLLRHGGLPADALMRALSERLSGVEFARTRTAPELAALDVARSLAVHMACA